MLEWFTAVFTLIGAIAWPAAVVLLGLLFRHEIRAKFGDIEQAGPAGVTFRLQQSSQALSIPSDLKALLPATTPFRQAVQDRITDDLGSLKDEVRVPVLVTALVTARIERVFEAVFVKIFNSQIDALRRLKAAGGRLPLADAEQYFEQVKAQYPEFYADASFASWADYLQKNHLVRDDGAEAVLTDTGDEFLDFVAGAKAGETRPY